MTTQQVANVIKNGLGVFGLTSMMLLAGCRTDAQTGAAIGTGAGAGLGAIIGYQSGSGWEGAAIGAGAGLLTGYIIGNESDKQKLHPSYDARNPSSYDKNYDY